MSAQELQLYTLTILSYCPLYFERKKSCVKAASGGIHHILDELKKKPVDLFGFRNFPWVFCKVFLFHLHKYFLEYVFVQLSHTHFLSIHYIM